MPSGDSHWMKNAQTLPAAHDDADRAEDHAINRILVPRIRDQPVAAL